MQTALARAAVLWIPFAVLLRLLWWPICGGWSFFDKPYKQGLHDKAAKTVVVTPLTHGTRHVAARVFGTASAVVITGRAGSRTDSAARARRGGRAAPVRVCSAARSRSDACGRSAGFGMGTVMATSRPRPSAATAMTATPTPELVWESSSMASVEKTTVAEP